MLSRRNFIKGAGAAVAAITVPAIAVTKAVAAVVKKPIFALSFPSTPGQTYRIRFNMKIGDGPWEFHDETTVAVKKFMKIISLDENVETYLDQIVVSKIDTMEELLSDPDWKLPSNWLQNSGSTVYDYGRNIIRTKLNPRAIRVNPSHARLKRAKQYMRR